MNVDTKSGKPINGRERERERNQRENLKDGSKLGMVRRTRSGLPQHAAKIKSKPYKTLMTRTIGSSLLVKWVFHLSASSCSLGLRESFYVLHG